MLRGLTAPAVARLARTTNHTYLVCPTIDGMQAAVAVRRLIRRRILRWLFGNGYFPQFSCALDKNTKSTSETGRKWPSGIDAAKPASHSTERPTGSDHDRAIRRDGPPRRDHRRNRQSRHDRSRTTPMARNSKAVGRGNRSQRWRRHQRERTPKARSRDKCPPSNHFEIISLTTLPMQLRKTIWQQDTRCAHRPQINRGQSFPSHRRRGARHPGAETEMKSSGHGRARGLRGAYRLLPAHIASFTFPCLSRP
jgi:hypothetical protein